MRETTAKTGSQFVQHPTGLPQRAAAHMHSINQAAGTDSARSARTVCVGVVCNAAGSVNIKQSMQNL